MTCFILWPFVTPGAWAVALAVLLQPAYRAARSARIQPSIAAAIVTCGLGITVFLPAVWVLNTLFDAAGRGMEHLGPSNLHGLWQRLMQNHPIPPTLEVIITNFINISARDDELLRALSMRIHSILKASLIGLVHGCLALFAVFFFLRDGEPLLTGLKAMMPLSEQDTDALIKRIVDTIHATLLGMVAVSILQGALGAALLWWLKIPGAVVWGAIMFLLALVPYLGAFVVWIPIAAFLAISGDWYRAIVTVLWGTVVIGLSDNLCYPYLVGRRLHYHSLLVFIFFVGGIVIFGAAGIVLGPVVLAITERLLWIWRRG